MNSDYALASPLARDFRALISTTGERSSVFESTVAQFMGAIVLQHHGLADSTCHIQSDFLL